MDKNLLLVGMALAAVPFLTGCNGEDSFSQTIPVNTTPINIITDLNTGTTNASMGGYLFNLVVTNEGQTGTISAKAEVNKDTPLTFTTEEKSYSTNGYYAHFQNVTSNTVNIKNSDFLLTPFYYRPENFKINSTFPDYRYVVVSSYYIGDSYHIRTFQPETFYYGTTNTSYPYMGQQQTYSTDDIYYQLSIDTEKFNTATLYIFNAKFSDSPEPRKEMIKLENLSVAYSENGISVTGENITPLVLEGNNLTPNDSFIFQDIRFDTTKGDLTDCNINFTVNASMSVNGMTVSYDYLGSFNGSYVYTLVNQ